MLMRVLACSCSASAFFDCFYRALCCPIQAAVMEYIPVVFFTAKGIPGEVEERLDTPAGLVAASMRAVGLGKSHARWVLPKRSQE